MLWQFLDPSLEEFAADLPLAQDCAVSMCRIGDHERQLYPAERDAMSSMLQKRRDGYSSGRYCAHLVQEQLELQRQPVLRRDRSPIWPAHSVGSITHSDEIAAALASTTHQGVGIDIEQLQRLEDKLFRVLFTERERARISTYQFDAATLMFSAKEAGYKAIYPKEGSFIGFQEAEIHLDPQNRSFSIDYVGAHAPNRLLNTGVGYWREACGHVLTMFFIP